MVFFAFAVGISLESERLVVSDPSQPRLDAFLSLDACATPSPTPYPSKNSPHEPPPSMASDTESEHEHRDDESVSDPEEVEDSKPKSALKKTRDVLPPAERPELPYAIDPSQSSRVCLHVIGNNQIQPQSTSQSSLHCPRKLFPAKPPSTLEPSVT